MILSLKKKTVLILLMIVFVASTIGVCFGVISSSTKPNLATTIVIDAGHGGKDGGAVGCETEVTESFLNLQYAQMLKKICAQYGYRVVMTRSDMGGLYSPFASNKKRSEMEKRKSIIEKANPDVVVSIHMNSFPSSEARGAQVFYAGGSLAGESLAESVQSSLHKNVDFSKKTAKIGDYYVLNCTEAPSILVECGFLSNPEEEKLLQDEEYMQKFCYSVFCGILTYYRF